MELVGGFTVPVHVVLCHFYVNFSFDRLQIYTDANLLICCCAVFVMWLCMSVGYRCVYTEQGICTVKTTQSRYVNTQCMLCISSDV